MVSLSEWILLNALVAGKWLLYSTALWPWPSRSDSYQKTAKTRTLQKGGMTLQLSVNPCWQLSLTSSPAPYLPNKPARSIVCSKLLWYPDQFHWNPITYQNVPVFDIRQLQADVCMLLHVHDNFSNSLHYNHFQTILHRGEKFLAFLQDILHGGSRGREGCSLPPKISSFLRSFREKLAK